MPLEYGAIGEKQDVDAFCVPTSKLPVLRHWQQTLWPNAPQSTVVAEFIQNVLRTIIVAVVRNHHLEIVEILE